MRASANFKLTATRVSCILSLSLALLVPQLCHSQSKCPWLNEATARGILGGPVALTAHTATNGTGVCEFTRQQGAINLLLRISVDLMTDIPKQFPTYLAQCGPTPTPLRAIGNEAVMCTLQDKDNHYSEAVVGRVRDQAFVVRVSSSVQNDASMTQSMRRQKANLVAEQLAGILF
ncbi:MAG: hypothetical protein WAK29_04605 [Terriglobales bacterium]